VLIFSRTKIGADRLAAAGRGASAAQRCTRIAVRISGVSQSKASRAGIQGARRDDIAARGLDIDAIHTVINYEVPDSADTYVQPGRSYGPSR